MHCLKNLRIGLAGALVLGVAGAATAETYIYVQNNTPFAFPVEIVRPSGLALGTAYWKAGTNWVQPGQRAMILKFNRDEGVKSGKYFEFHNYLSMNGTKFALKQRLKGTTFNSDLWQSVQGQPWYSDRNTHQATWNAGAHSFNIKYRAYFTGGADDVEYIIQYKYPNATAGSNTFSVLSYNTYMRPTSLFVNGQSARQKLMMPQLRGQGYDAILFSEMFDDDIRNRTIADLASEFPYKTKVVGRDAGVNQDGGVIIMSRWPITAWAEKTFGSVSSGSDSMADKGIMYACINKQGRKYHLFGTHTQADKGSADVSTRKKQLQMLKAFVDSRNIPATEPVILGGDLNVDMTGSPAEYNSMLSILNAAHPMQLGNLKATWDPTINKCADAGKPEFLDYLLFSKAHLKPLLSTNEVRLLRSWDGWKSLPTDKERWDLSDHFAVFGQFVFKK